MSRGEPDLEQVAKPLRPVYPRATSLGAAASLTDSLYSYPGESNAKRVREALMALESDQDSAPQTPGEQLAVLHEKLGL